MTIMKSVKENELDRILDKLSNAKIITDIEKRFLDNYDNISIDLVKDYSLLTNTDVYNRLSKILNLDIKANCDLYDRDGLIGIEILSVQTISEGNIYLILKNGEKMKLSDKFLYNMTYDFKNCRYSLNSHDEYYEKILVNND